MNKGYVKTTFAVVGGLFLCGKDTDALKEGKYYQITYVGGCGKDRVLGDKSWLCADETEFLIELEDGSQHYMNILCDIDGDGGSLWEEPNDGYRHP